MKTVNVKGNIHWVGIIDWDLRYFHGPSYTTHRGTTYNSYLIQDEQPTLVDTVFAPFGEEFLDKISSLINPADIKYVVVNHLETDHSGSLPRIMEAAPGATILCSPRAAASMNKIFHREFPLQVVKSGDAVNIGKYNLNFLEAPMLHWPDSMFTYIPEEKLLMPNDAFGQHYASSGRFDEDVDQCVLMQEARKYYANILLPLSKMVQKKLAEVQKLGLEIEMIAPSHGIIWRNPARIIEAYSEWSAQKPLNKAIVVYETMWGSTAKMARAVMEGLGEAGMEAVLYEMKGSDYSDIISDLVDTALLVIGSPTIHRDFLPSLSSFLDDLAGLKPAGKKAASFGSHGWSKGSTEKIGKRLESAGFEVISEPMDIFWVPASEDLQACREYGKKLAEAAKPE